MTDEIVQSEKYLIEHLEKKHKKDIFSCGSEPLDRYLKTQASQDIKKNVAVTYVLSTVNSADIVGYYTISSVSILYDELPADIIKKLPRYPNLPGILLGRLAVDNKYHGKKFGQLLLVDALKRCVSVSHQIGIMAIIVDAKDDAAVAFYKHFGFAVFPENQTRLFLPLETIKLLQL